MAAVPVVVVPTMVVPMMSPAYLFGLESADLRLCRDSGMNIPIRGRQRRRAAKRLRRERGGLRGHGERCGTGCNPNGDFQKIAAFHEVSLFISGE
jgi:hypothetical protein